MSKFRNIVILTGAGLSAESGLGTFRGQGGLWENFQDRGRGDARRFRSRSGPCARLLQSPPLPGTNRRGPMQPISPLPGSSASTATSSPSPRISTRCTKPPARRTSSICMASWSVRCALPAGSARRGSEDLSIETLCASCGRAAMRPDVVWFGEMPRADGAHLRRARRQRPVHLHRHERHGLSRGRLRDGGPRRRRSCRRAQSRALRRRRSVP